MSGSTRRKPVVIPARKPMASARRVSLFDRKITVRLSSAAVELLLAQTAVLSEGQLEGEHYFGSTMVTIDLKRAEARLSDCCDLTTAGKVADLIVDEPRIHERTREIAIREAERLSQCALEQIQVDIRVRRSGTHLHLDMDVEATAGEAA